MRDAFSCSQVDFILTAPTFQSHTRKVGNKRGVLSLAYYENVRWVFTTEALFAIGIRTEEKLTILTFFHRFLLILYEALLQGADTLR